MSQDNDNILINIARGIVKESYGGHLSVGMVTKHPDGRIVMIISGEFFDSTYGRLSNHWEWREVLQNGTLSPVSEYGYGWTDPIVLDHEIKVVLKNAS